MRHFALSLHVPPHRVEELLDRIHTIATEYGTLSITSLIDEYREDVHIEFRPKERSRHGRSNHEDRQARR